MSANDEFEARRKSRQKAIKRRRRKKFFIFFLILLLITAVILSLTVFFRVENIGVTGSKIYSAKEISAAAGVKNRNMFLLTEEKVANSIRPKCPYVDSVKLDRSLPDKLNIKVTDAVPYSYYIKEGKFYTVSKKGYVLSQDDAEPQGLLKILCGDISAVPGKKLTVISKRQRELVEKITAELQKNGIAAGVIDVSNTVAIKLSVENRFEVVLGTSDYLSKKTAHLKGMIKNIEPDKTGTIDLSMWTPENSQGSFMKN